MVVKAAKKKASAKRSAGQADLSSGARVRYSISLVTQGQHRFYTLSMPSETLAQCCYATSRDEDPVAGFQRVLDVSRATDIANYIDNDLGSIPSSIVLSAQPEADIKVLGSGKTIEFSITPHSFLIIDGQHRVFGFSIAKTNLRVPVVIYSGLTKLEESRLFIDINTKQKPVPNELLLDIKHLAQYENSKEALLRALFDCFQDDSQSALYGLLSPSSKRMGKVSRVTFNHGMKSALGVFSTPDVDVIYPAVNGYLLSFMRQMRSIGVEEAITAPIIFRAVLEVFPDVAQRVSDRYAGKLRESGFLEVLKPMFARVKVAWFQKPPKSHNALAENLGQALRSAFKIG